MLCQIDNQITMLQLINMQPEILIKNDVIQKDSEIFVSDQNYLSWNLPEWIPADAWGKRLKDGNYVFHSFKANGKPKNPRTDNQVSLLDLKRRFLFKLMLDPGNPTWKDVEDFTRWIEAYDQAQTVEETKAVICDKYCLTCRKRKRNSCKNSDIGEDALLLSVNGFNR